MKRARLIPILLLCTLAATARAAQDGRAHDVASKLFESMGGQEKWQRLRVLRFDWAVERDGQEVARARHLWDRERGRYRVEWRTREGNQVQAVFDVATRRGQAWVDGSRTSGADSTSWLEKAYGRYINDSYWLLMPWKLEDPGTQLAHAGEAMLDGKAYDLLHLKFGTGVGLTPGDQYWIYVNRESHRVDRWAYFLEGMEGEPSLERATVWTWGDWQQVGGVWLAADRRQEGGEGTRRIHFPVLQAPTNLDPRVFESIDVPLPEPAAR